MTRTPSATPPAMSSSRPYLIRALYQWIGDNGLTPYLLVDAAAPGLRVPPQAVQDGRVVLNVAARAVVNLELADDVISFQARFNGVPLLVLVPVAGVLAIYAAENGQGMVLPPEPDMAAAGDTAPGLAAVADAPPAGDGEPAPELADGAAAGPAPDNGTGDAVSPSPGPAQADDRQRNDPERPGARKNHLRLIK